MFKRTLMFLFLFALPLAAQRVAAPEGTVVPQGSANQLLIVAAGAVPGANGTFFRSDINLINYRNADQLVRLRWIPQAGLGAPSVTRDITIRAASGIQSEDFVTQVLGQTGLGSILITAITASGTADPNGALYASARIWSPQAGTTNGTTSQTFDVIPTTELQGRRLSFIGVKRDDRYRVNVGIVNLDQTNTQTFQIILAGDTPTLAPEVSTITLPPLTMTQVNLAGPSHNTIQIAVQNTSNPIITPLWYAYASSVDNVTGDSWSEIGFVAPQDRAATP